MTHSYCIFSALYLPNMGGIEKYTYNMAKALVARGNKVTIVTSLLEGTKTSEVIEGIEIIRVPSFNLLNGRLPVSKPNKKFQNIKATLLKRKFDVVIVNTRFYLHSIFGMRFAKKINSLLLTIEHGTNYLTFNNTFLDILVKVYEHSITAVGKRYCKNYYGVSHLCNDWLKQFKIDAKGVLYNYIDIEEVEMIKSTPKISYRMLYNIPKDAIVVTFTGRLVKEKGILNLVDAIDKLYQENKNIYLMIAGEGNCQTVLEQIHNKNIILLGKLDFKHIIHLLSESNIFCLPSVSEGFSLSILEAVACRCYIITTEKVGAKELICNDKYGTVIKNNDTQLIYESLKKVLTEKKMMEKSVDLSYNKLVKDFTGESLVDTLEKVVKELENESANNNTSI